MLPVRRTSFDPVDPTPEPPASRRYATAVLIWAIASALTLLLRDLISPATFLFFHLAVLLSAWYGGRGAGMLTGVLAFAIGDFFLFPPAGTFKLYAPAEGFLLGAFLAAAYVTSTLTDRLRAARRDAERSAREAGDLTVELEQQVEETQQLMEELERSHAHLDSVRIETERANGRLRRLYSIVTSLAGTLTPAEVARVILEQGVAAIGARAGVLGQVTRDGAAVDLIDSTGVPADVVERWRRVPLDAGSPLSEAARIGEPIVLESAAERVARYPHLEEFREWLGTGALAAVPLLASGRALGALVLVFAEARDVPDDDLAFIGAVAHHCAEALVRARLNEAGRETAERLREAKEAAEEASRVKSQFLAVMSHELRTPLNAIIGYQDLLDGEVGGPLNATQRDQLRRIRESAWHLLELINEILTLSRIEAGKEDLRLDRVDLYALVRDAVALIAPQASHHGLDLDVRAPVSPLHVTTDPGKVRQILLNLLSNAVKFTEHGRIQVETRRTRRRIRILVRDTGIGIEPANQARIFEPFSQVDQSATREKGGSGLGLPVSRQLARLLGGDLSLESVPGKGSTFTVELPLDLPDDPADPSGSR